MNRRVAIGLVLLVMGIAGLIWAAVSWINVGIYADATGSSGYVPVGTWIGGLSGVCAIVAAVIVMNGRPQRA